MYNNPYMMSMARPGLISRAVSMFRGVNFGSLLDGAGKTLGVINQAIPIVNQVKPIINNAKTMFKIAGELKGNNSFNNTVSSFSNNEVSQVSSITNKPIFYV